MIGVILGLLIAILIVATLTYLKHPIQQGIARGEAKLRDIAPHPKGFIIEPDNEATQARNEIIANNKKNGKITKLQDLL